MPDHQGLFVVTLGAVEHGKWSPPTTVFIFTVFLQPDAMLKTSVPTPIATFVMTLCSFATGIIVHLFQHRNIIAKATVTNHALWPRDAGARPSNSGEQFYLHRDI
jgi:hypothetical protein